MVVYGVGLGGRDLVGERRTSSTHILNRSHTGRLQGHRNLRTGKGLRIPLIPTGLTDNTTDHNRRENVPLQQGFNTFFGITWLSPEYKVELRVESDATGIEDGKESRKGEHPTSNECAGEPWRQIKVTN